MNADHQRQLLNLTLAEGNGQKVCTVCHHHWKPNSVARALVQVCAALLLMVSFAIAFMTHHWIWVLLLVGSIIALVARPRCPACKATACVPMKSPRGQEIIHAKLTNIKS